MDYSGKMLRNYGGYGLTTAQIVYRMPDRLECLQEFVWQEYDVFPRFPMLNKFLRFWEQEIEGPLHSVTVAHQQLLRPTELAMLDGAYRIN